MLKAKAKAKVKAKVDMDVDVDVGKGCYTEVFTLNALNNTGRGVVGTRPA